MKCPDFALNQSLHRLTNRSLAVQIIDLSKYFVLTSYRADGRFA
jgi:hypothetical protein